MAAVEDTKKGKHEGHEEHEEILGFEFPKEFFVSFVFFVF